MEKRIKLRRYKEYFKQNLKLFLESFKEKKIVYIALLDFIFLILFTSLVLIFLSLLQKEIMSLTAISPGNIANIAFPSDSNIGMLTSLIGGFNRRVISYILASVVGSVTLYSLLKGKVWSIALGRKTTKRFFLRFILLNLIIFPILLLLSFLATKGVKGNLIIPVLAVIFAVTLHFLNILYVVFMLKTTSQALSQGKIQNTPAPTNTPAPIKHTTKSPIRSSIKKAVSTGIKKLHLFLLPYSVMFLLFLGIAFFSARVLKPHCPSESLVGMVNIIMLLFYFAWIKIYLSRVIEGIVIIGGKSQG